MAILDWRALHGTHFERVRCVVTGGAGFIGSHLAEALVTLGAEVVVLDDLSGCDPDDPRAGLTWYREGAGSGTLDLIEASITDPSAVDAAVAGARYVFHQAAWGSVPRSVEMPLRYHQINTTGTLNVLEASRAAGVRRVMFAASSSAYGDTPTLPKHEQMPVSPRSPYAANKVAGEAMMRAWACSYGRGGAFDTVALRYFNIFGPRQNANSAYAAVIAAFRKALQVGERPVIFGDGEQSRDFTFVDNAVHANLLAARSETPLSGEPINIACGERVTVNALAAAMAEAVGRSELTPEHRPERVGDVKHSLADLARARALIGYEPRVGFREGLDAVMHETH